MQQTDFSLPIQQFVSLLVAADYQAVVEMSHQKDRQQAVWIADAIHLYPGQLTLPPVTAYDTMDVYGYDDGSGYLMEFFLWVDQKPSDLIIRVDARWANNQLHYTFWDILVP
ncbi:DUF7668 domain-containing protein [Hymenobacter cavernae]|uniref:DUF7668 domain-containing protein n=1 Tax=Hymenobacter cavernae TaxID=2044852 RepID=A0ABQ1TIB2_9BACT|nr:hypothetical protein [Hymenobacter cavernae]GGE94035.1 hypothetical protein GCM10011383_00920 [Hymenobacter cavernae]